MICAIVSSDVGVSIYLHRFFYLKSAFSLLHYEQIKLQHYFLTSSSRHAVADEEVGGVILCILFPVLAGVLNFTLQFILCFSVLRNMHVF